MLAPRLLFRCSPLPTGPQPVLLSLTLSQDREMTCFESWRLQASWTIGNEDILNYSLSLFDIGDYPQTIATGILCIGGSSIFDTIQYGDTTAPILDFTKTVQFRLDLVRTIDSATVQSLTSIPETKYYGACGA